MPELEPTAGTPSAPHPRECLKCGRTFLSEGLDAGHPRHKPAFAERVANDKIELQIRVDSVDAWAERLDGSVDVEGPVTRPWGNRYLWMRDPDGVRVALFQGAGE